MGVDVYVGNKNVILNLNSMPLSVTKMSWIIFLPVKALAAPGKTASYIITRHISNN